ncbi:hypothetical protein E0Z10_g3611 [Xylaria hypoxylon]|uniref:Ribosomal RNA methyltransferase FtsJ domain-containing protein n=1 Tax=Xylaria hypoxylon TaxID=37992 RepID=A0A4Z0Z0A3_9PEZI|nr:hypothetical protein E0Z10_g3611 [Xylaria hypoxylon]
MKADMENTSTYSSVLSQGGGETEVDDTTMAIRAYDQAVKHACNQIRLYLLERIPNFRTLTDLKEKGWNNPAGDHHFAKQRRQADRCSEKQASYFFNMMRVAHRRSSTYAWHPGLFSIARWNTTPWLRLALSVPLDKGGHKALLRRHPSIDIEFIDITMLGADMGVASIPPAHPDTHEFLPQKLYAGDVFDLAICDGQVLRTHSRAAYRESREPARLTMTQLAISLEHMKPGGTMLVLLHKVESWKSVLILRTFCGFSDVKVFKPTRAHATRSSCYMVASNIQSQHEDAIRAIQRWKQLWKAATFGTEVEFGRLAVSLDPDVEDVLEDFGMRLVELGEEAWETQAHALAKAPFVRETRA